MRPPTSGNPRACEIDHPGRLRQLAVEPRLHGVAVGRGDVERLARHQRAHVAGDQQRRHRRWRPLPARAERHEGRRAPGHERNRDRGGERAPARNRLRTRQRGDAAAELRARPLARHAFPDRAAQRHEARLLGGERGIGGQTLLEFQCMGGIELAVDIGVQPQAIVGRGGHRSAPKVSIRRSRARASRDITVPMGTPVISAISR